MGSSFSGRGRETQMSRIEPRERQKKPQHISAIDRNLNYRKSHEFIKLFFFASGRSRANVLNLRTANGREAAHEKSPRIFHPIFSKKIRWLNIFMH